MKLLWRGALLVGLLGLGACVQSPLVTAPVTNPSGSSNHPRFAPPPGVASQWDAQLGVYVVGGASHLYYRERTYYRWNSGWSWASNPQGPWLPTDSSGVPPGLFRRYAQ
ncbi:hypothetical protein [Pseudomonas sp.]|uniref:hypothetical protein n=1 Tax=Pseudomonas sp. TaxID=306 RepID=UPI003BB6BBFE